jgi:hypothetical protein
VNSAVQNHAAARFVDAPTLQVRRKISGMEDADEKRCADGPGMYQLADLAMGGRVAQMVVGAMTTPALALAATISRASTRLRASGFSHSTCLPAAAAASVCAPRAIRWRPF